MKTDDRYMRFMLDCCERQQVELADVLGRSNESGPVMHARHAMGWLLRGRFGLSYPHLGRVLCRDHTTVMNSAKKFAAALERCDAWAVEIIELCGTAGRTALPLEGPLDSLRSCTTGIELATEAVG